MKNAEFVLREILYQVMEKKNRTMTQSELSKHLKLSLSVVNSTVQKMQTIGAVEVHQRSLHVIDTKKILYYWASIRNIPKDILYSTRVEQPVKEIEKDASPTMIFTAYTGYKRIFHDVPADYSEVYIYGDETAKKRYPEKKGTKGVPNVYILTKDKLMERYGTKTTIANTFVDLWNIKEWYAKEFIQSMEEHINGILE